MPKAVKVDFMNEWGNVFTPGNIVEILNTKRKVMAVGRVKKLGKSRIYVTYKYTGPGGVVSQLTTAYKPMYLQRFSGDLMGDDLQEALGEPGTGTTKEQEVVSKPKKKTGVAAKKIGTTKASTKGGATSKAKLSSKKTAEKG